MMTPHIVPCLLLRATTSLPSLCLPSTPLSSVPISRPIPDSTPRPELALDPTPTPTLETLIVRYADDPAPAMLVYTIPLPVHRSPPFVSPPLLRVPCI